MRDHKLDYRAQKRCLRRAFEAVGSKQKHDARHGKNTHNDNHEQKELLSAGIAPYHAVSGSGGHCAESYIIR